MPSHIASFEFRTARHARASNLDLGIKTRSDQLAAVHDQTNSKLEEVVMCLCSARERHASTVCLQLL